MNRRAATLVAVSIAVVAELLLGVLLVVNGGGTPAVVNPWRVGDGFPQPPPCSMIDRALVEKLTGPGSQLEDVYSREDDDPVRRCTFTAATPERGKLDVMLQSRVYGNGPLEIRAPGLSGFLIGDNLSTHEVKRYYDNVSAQFTVDNLDVRMFYNFRIPNRNGDLPAQPEADRVRADAAALARNIAGKLTPRNKQVPSSTR